MYIVVVVRFCSGLFIIDGNSILRQITMNDLPVGRSVDETLRLVQAFQYTDQHGEVCPAEWKPGADTVRHYDCHSNTYRCAKQLFRFLNQ